jgi:hypothetical protein
MRIIAERAAVAAHLDTERADLVIARRVEQPGQNDQYTKYIVDLVALGFRADLSIALLTRRANQGHTDIVAKALRPAAHENGSGLFAFRH